MQGPCIDRAGRVQGVCIKCSLCRDRAGTVQGVCMDRAGRVQGVCRDRAGSVHGVCRGVQMLMFKANKITTIRALNLWATA